MYKCIENECGRSIGWYCDHGSKFLGSFYLPIGTFGGDGGGGGSGGDRTEFVVCE